jgi:PAS domain S-box-containing protein
MTEQAIDPGSLSKNTTDMGVVTNSLAAEDKYSVLFNDSPDASMILDNGIIVDCNRTMELVLRGNRSQIIGLTPDQISPDYQQDGRASKEAAPEKIAKALETGFNLFEWTHRRFDGSEFLAEISLSHLIIQGRSVLFASWHDISERKKAQEALQNERTLFRTIIDLIPDAVYVKNLEGQKVFANPKEVELSGKSSEDEIIGKTDFDLYGESIANHAKDEDQYVIETGNPLLGVMTKRKGNDEMFRYYLGSKVPLRDTYGNITGVVGVTHDITEQKQSEQALIDNEVNFRTLFETIDYLIIIANEKGELLYSNDAVIKKLGYSKDELVGMNVIELYPFDLRSDAARIFSEMLIGSQNACPHPFCRKDGSFVSVETRAWMGKWDGKDCIFSISKDLSKEEESFQKFTKIFENNPSLMAISSIPELKFTEVNSVFLNKTGYSREEVIGKSVGQLNLFIEPEKQKEVSDELKTNGFVHNFELKVKTKTGDVMIGLFSGEIIENQGKKYFLTVMVDVTDSKNLEREIQHQNSFYNVIATISEKLIQADSDQLDFEINKSLESIGSFSEVDRSNIYQLDADNDLIYNTYKWNKGESQVKVEKIQGIPFSFIPLWKEKFLKNEHIYIESIRDLPDERNHERDFFGSMGIQSLVAVPMYYGASMIGFVAFDSVIGKKRWNDQTITSLKIYANILAGVINKKMIEATLLKAKEEADTASKFKSEFLANMSHEIRTPLNGVIGFTDLLLRTPLNKIQQQYAENVNTSGHSLLGIINDILDFSKIEAGKMELDFIKTDLIELAEQSCDIIKYLTSLKGIEFLLNIQPDLPRFAVTDPQRLKQILINLLSNAVKFTDKGEIELKLTFVANDDQRGSFIFSVRDTGIGIMPEQQVKLFKAFTQADSSTTRKFGGTGLGLTISNMLAQKMGSKIEIQSEFGKGSNFFFTLEAEYEFGEKQGHGSLSDIHRVLVIDDNDNNRMILEHTFTNLGIGFVGIDNGYSAIKIIEESGTFDVIIVDYHMPYLNGLETVRIIREKLGLIPERQPVILLHSSSDDIKIYEECKELGVKYNLIKPVKSNELLYYLQNIHDGTILEAKKVETILTVDPKEFPDDLEPVILIAEDVLMNMMLAKTFIKQIIPNADILEARNGIEAVEIAKKRLPDLIFMDVQMPEMGGIEATLLLRDYEQQTGVRIPIVALTAGAIKEEKDKCLDAGMDCFLTKPIETKALYIILRQFLIESDNQVPEIQDETTNRLNIVHFDQDQFMENISHNQDLFKELIEMTPEQFSGDIALLKNSIDKNESDNIKKAAHAIKGVSLGMCFNHLAELARGIELDSEKETSTKIKARFDELVAEWVLINEIIRKLEF